MHARYSLTDALMQLNQPATLTETALPKYVVTPMSLHSDSDSAFIIGGFIVDDWKFVDAAVNIGRENGRWCLSSASPAEIAKPDVVLERRSADRRVKKTSAIEKPKRPRHKPVVHRRSAADQARLSKEAEARQWRPNVGCVASDPGRLVDRGVVMSNAQLIGMGPNVTSVTRDAIRTLLTFPIDDMVEMLRDNTLPATTPSGRPRAIGSGRIM